MSLTTKIATLIAAAIAAVASLASLFLNSRLTFDRERRQTLFRNEIDRLFAVEELAGSAMELIASYAPVEAKRQRVAELLVELDEFAGRLARYPDVRQPVRDLSNTCKRLYDARSQKEDERPIRAELEPAYTVLISAVDRVVRPTSFGRNRRTPSI